MPIVVHVARGHRATRSQHRSGHVLRGGLAAFGDRHHPGVRPAPCSAARAVSLQRIVHMYQREALGQASASSPSVRHHRGHRACRRCLRHESCRPVLAKAKNAAPGPALRLSIAAQAIRLTVPHQPSADDGQKLLDGNQTIVSSRWQHAPLRRRRVIARSCSIWYVSCPFTSYHHHVAGPGHAHGVAYRLSPVQDHRPGGIRIAHASGDLRHYGSRVLGSRVVRCHHRVVSNLPRDGAHHRPFCSVPVAPAPEHRDEPASAEAPGRGQHVP